MRVTVIKDHEDFKKGDIIEVEDNLVQGKVNEGLIMAVGFKAQKEYVKPETDIK